MLHFLHLKLVEKTPPGSVKTQVFIICIIIKILQHIYSDKKLFYNKSKNMNTTKIYEHDSEYVKWFKF